MFAQKFLASAEPAPISRCLALDTAEAGARQPRPSRLIDWILNAEELSDACIHAVYS